MSGIDNLLETVEWVTVDEPNRGDGSLPWVTKHGSLRIAGLEIRCYVLSDGRRIFDGEDLVRFVGAMA